ncbi:MULTISPECIES: phage distal tail protein [unclassified Paenibacillus]|uniref:phage distal tail protein n=1 Tax=unclassified Paenibacillus TaxID=185978 RepID=UPI002117519A|nr:MULTISPECIES: phage tail domain-containing protein [unclassified Paenibacillus]
MKAMFNRGAFNRMAFNRQISVFVFGRAVADISGSAVAAATMEMTGSAVMDVNVGAAGDFIREISFAAVMDVAAGTKADFIREITKRAIMNVGFGAVAKGSRYHVEFLEFTGPFKPGDKIEIDAKTYRITQNGINAAGLMEGDFFNLNVGENRITYTDPETNRQVLLRITHRDRFLY